MKILFLYAMNFENLQKSLGTADIYIIDQFMKSGFSKSDKILDAGCGNGRNLIFLNLLAYHVEGCDINNTSISLLQQQLPTINLKTTTLLKLAYQNNEFDYIICNAVLHFAKSKMEFKNMISELHRVLKSNGTLFIRMTSIFGIESLVQQKDEQYLLPDGSIRFLLNTTSLEYINTKFPFKEPLKTVNVNNMRTMSTLVLTKV